MTFQPYLIHFILTAVLSLLVGMEVKTYRQKEAKDRTPFFFFGTARTFAFVGILGFILYRLDPTHLIPYTVFMALLTWVFTLFYRKRLHEGHPGILLYVVLLCVYSFGPLSERLPLWAPTLLFVTVLFVLNAQEAIDRFTQGADTYEFETLGKMVLLSAVILPLLPNHQVVSWLPLSPFKIWLAVVVISGISYGGYLAQKYFFPNRGYLLTGIIGGTYSSTATTVVLSRKARSIGGDAILDAAIVAATSMMYLRLIVVAAIFNFTIAERIALPFVVLAAVGFLVAFGLTRYGRQTESRSDFVDHNPLELGTALLFAALFVAMMMLTQYVTQHFGTQGLQILSFVIGFTDIDPFVLSLLTGKYTVTTPEITSAVMIAAGSNGLLKALYALWFGGVKRTWKSALVVAVLGLLTIGWGFII
ncbi:MgtC/SapB family protein [Nitratifractor sp.]